MPAAFLEIEENHSASYEDEDHDETGKLLSASPKHQSSVPRRRISKGRGFMVKPIVLVSMVVLAFFLKSALLGRGSVEGASKGNPYDTTKRSFQKKNSNDGLAVHYDCPAINYKPPDPDQVAWYDDKSREIAAKVADFLTVFRQSEFDNWGHSYEEVKQGMYAWKSKQFKDLKDGAAIYESACGIGLNMYMTLEILESETQLKNIQVYGNDYVPESVNIAREVWKKGRDLPAQAIQGQICAGDSRDLLHVPDASFDLVYTGYITPMMDPLHFNGTSDYNYGRLTEICEAKTDPARVRLAAKAQKTQEDWYGAWVGEMIRIAKPGAPVIVEQVSYPFCGAYYDWGGVEQEFWPAAIGRYKWDVDPKSFVFERDTIFRKRYHVSMKKATE